MMEDEISNAEDRVAKGDPVPPDVAEVARAEPAAPGPEPPDPSVTEARPTDATHGDSFDFGGGVDTMPLHD